MFPHMHLITDNIMYLPTNSKQLKRGGDVSIPITEYSYVYNGSGDFQGQEVEENGLVVKCRRGNAVSTPVS